jgi:hypothetical protein
VNVKKHSGEQWSLTTDEDGTYELKDPADGEYEITVDHEDFKGKKRIVKIKKASR